MLMSKAEVSRSVCVVQSSKHGQKNKHQSYRVCVYLIAFFCCFLSIRLLYKIEDIYGFTISCSPEFHVPTKHIGNHNPQRLQPCCSFPAKKTRKADLQCIHAHVRYSNSRSAAAACLRQHLLYKDLGLLSPVARNRVICKEDPH